MINLYSELSKEFTECDLCGKEIDSIEDSEDVREQLLKNSNGYTFCYDCMVEDFKNDKSSGHIDLRCVNANDEDFGFCMNCENIYPLDTMQKEKEIGLLCEKCLEEVIEKAKAEGKELSFDEGFLGDSDFDDDDDNFDDEDEW